MDRRKCVTQPQVEVAGPEEPGRFLQPGNSVLAFGAATIDAGVFGTLELLP